MAGYGKMDNMQGFDILSLYGSKPKEGEEEEENTIEKFAKIQEAMSQYKDRNNSPMKRAAMFRYLTNA